jgi:hypothetical protein
LFCTPQVDQILNPKEGRGQASKLPSHAPMEDFLGRYCGLMLFVKEIDYGRYQQICSVRSSEPLLDAGSWLTGVVHFVHRLISLR